MTSTALSPTPAVGAAADPRWAAVLARDPRADGAFWYAVATTGIYCRPSCPSRRPRPEHVTFHDTPAAARASGARACRRCDPDGTTAAERHAALVSRACRLIDGAEAPPRLDALAGAVGLSPGHLHRLFRAATGVSPRAYAEARRAERVRAALGAGGSVTASLYDAGFQSSGRFYARAQAMLGMRPTRYARGGRHETLAYSTGASALGTVLVASSGRGIAAILLGEDAATLERALAERFPHATLVAGGGDHARTVEAVIRLADTPAAGLDLPLDIRGTAFQQRVWEALRAIPPGETRSYAAVADAIGAPQATRAVAGACAANAHAIAIPCHRVVRSDGALSGYRWGPERKRALLDREAAGPRSGSRNPASATAAAMSDDGG